MSVAEATRPQLSQEDEEKYRRSAKRGAVGSQVNFGVLTIVLVTGAILFLLPMYLMVATSLKSDMEVATTTAWQWPAKPTWNNYVKVITDPNINFFRATINTLILSITPTIGTMITAAMAAFAFARMEFRGRDRLFIVLLSTMMLPGVVTMIPGYVLNAKLGWIDTYYPWIVGSWLGGGAFNIFLIRQTMLAIPREFDEAATIDGANNAIIFWRILLPNCGPVLATIGILGFIGGFKDFMGPLIMLNSPEKMPLEVALRSLQTSHNTQYNLLMAGSVITTLPLFIVFIVCQKYFVKGLSLSGGK